MDGTAPTNPEEPGGVMGADQLAEGDQLHLGRPPEWHDTTDQYDQAVLRERFGGEVAAGDPADADDPEDVTEEPAYNVHTGEELR